MASQTLLKRGSAVQVKASITSSRQAKRLQTALKCLQNYDLRTLEKCGRVKKLNVTCPENIYTFRVGPKERIVFSQIHGKNIIHDIVKVQGSGNTKSLLVNAEDK